MSARSFFITHTPSLNISDLFKAFSSSKI
jgi:hypothetical protein